MKSLKLTIVISLVGILSFGQTIKTQGDVDLIKSKIDNQINLKSFVISAGLLNGKGETIPGKFSYKFIYDMSSNLLVKIDIIDSESNETQAFYFSNDQLVLVSSKMKTDYFIDSDFDIPSWGSTPNKLTIQRDKLKETAYRLLIRFKKNIKKELGTQQ